MTTTKPIKKFNLLLLKSSYIDKNILKEFLKPFFSKIVSVDIDINFIKIFKSENFDIILSGSDRLDDIEKLKEINPNIEIIIIGSKNSDELLKAVNINVYKYLTLPLNLNDLKTSLQKLETKIFLQKAKEYNTFLLHQYKAAIDSSNIVSKTDINGIITYANNEFCKISKYQRENLIGQNHNIVRHPDVPKETFEKFWKVILSKQIWKGTVKNRAKDGETFYLNTTVIPILDSRSEIVEFVAIRYDVTKNIKLQERLKKKEEELKRLNINLEKKVQEQTKKLRELNINLEKKIKEEVKKNREKDRLMFQQARLASLGEMLGNIAHQWRQPLMELGLLIYQIKKSFKADNLDDMKMQKLYEKSNFIIERMSQTIIDFQNFFKPDKKYEYFSIKEALNYSLAIVKGSLKRENISIKIKSKSDIIVKGFQNEFSQVIVNIINNAKDALIKKMKCKRKIEIEIQKEESCFLFGETRSDKTAVITIKDNGGGIDNKIIDKIFEPYFTTKHSSQGTGLGLYMSKMIIEQSMKGLLEAKNLEDGALFTIKLPIIEKGDDEVQRVA